MLFDGFKHFLPSLVATLIRMAPIWVVSIPGSVVIMVLYINLLTRQPGQPITADAAWTILAAYGIYLAALAAVWLVVAVLSFFTYPLIVDRKLSGLDERAGGPGQPGRGGWAGAVDVSAGGGGRAGLLRRAGPCAAGPLRGSGGRLPAGVPGPRTAAAAGPQGGRRTAGP
jgi:hypothetical protein